MEAAAGPSRCSCTLTAAELSHYREFGWVVVPQLLSDADLSPIDTAYAEVVDKLATGLLQEGRISSTHVGLPHEKRLAALLRELGDDVYDTFQIHELEGEWPETFDIYQARLPACFQFMFNERLGKAIESLLGTQELTVHPSQHVRPYLPRRAASAAQPNHAAWHQDRIVYQSEADKSCIVTCWMPLVDVTASSGCLRLIPGVQEMLRTVQGTKAPGCNGISSPAIFDGQPSAILPAELDRAVAAIPGGGGAVDVAMRRGDLLVFKSLIPHCGLPNDSGRIRWSIELRFQTSDTPTGRNAHPSVRVRSKDPRKLQTDYGEWCGRWEAALSLMKGWPHEKVVAAINGATEWAELWQQGGSQAQADARSQVIAATDREGIVSDHGPRL